MSGPSWSDATQTTSSTTSSVSDSYNSTVNRIANLSDVGNVSISLGAGKDSTDISKVLPMAIAGVIGIVALAVMGRGR